MGVDVHGSVTGGRLFGREADLEAVQSFPQDAERAVALLVTGEAGVGKTVVLQEAAQDAAAVGKRVVQAVGAQFEADIAFAGLHQILHPLLSHLRELPVHHRVALEVALALADGVAADREIVGDATLELLGRAAAASPVLLVVDDLPWQ
jgi:predicted ATPase